MHFSAPSVAGGVVAIVVGGVIAGTPAPPAGPNVSVPAVALTADEGTFNTLVDEMGLIVNDLARDELFMNGRSSIYADNSVWDALFENDSIEAHDLTGAVLPDTAPDLSDTHDLLTAENTLSEHLGALWGPVDRYLFIPIESQWLTNANLQISIIGDLAAAIDGGGSAELESAEHLADWAIFQSEAVEFASHLVNNLANLF